MNGLTLIYPDLQADMLCVRFGNGATLKVQDVLARTVYQEFISSDEFELNIKDWQEGVYFCTVNNFRINFKKGFV